MSVQSLRSFFRYIRDNKKSMFWVWIAYQAIKGMTTMTLIWIPLFLLWKRSGGADELLRDWWMFLAANLLFVLSHIFLFLPFVRRTLSGVLTPSGHLIFGVLISFVTFAFALFSAIRAPNDVIWPLTGFSFGAGVAFVVLGIGLISFGVSIVNPFSAFAKAGSYEPDKPGILAVTRHPVFWGIALWAQGHVLLNGQIALALFFLLQMIYATVGAIGAEQRKKREIGPDVSKLRRGTSFFPDPFAIPRAIRNSTLSGRQTLVRFIIWFGLVFALVALHPVVLGVSPLALLGVG